MDETIQLKSHESINGSTSILISNQTTIDNLKLSKWVEKWIDNWSNWSIQIWINEYYQVNGRNDSTKKLRINQWINIDLDW